MILGTFFKRNPTCNNHTSRKFCTGSINSTSFGVTVQTVSTDRIMNGSCKSTVGDFLHGGCIAIQHGTFGTTFNNYRMNCDKKYPLLRSINKSADYSGFALASEYFTAHQMMHRLHNVGFSVKKIYGEREIITRGVNGGVAYGTDGTFLISRSGAEYLYPIQVTSYTKEQHSIKSVKTKVLAKLKNTKSAILSMTSSKGVNGKYSNIEVHDMKVYGANISFVVRNQHIADKVHRCIMEIMIRDTLYERMRISCTILVVDQVTSTSFMYFDEHCKNKRPRSISVIERESQHKKKSNMNHKPRCKSV